MREAAVKTFSKELAIKLGDEFDAGAVTVGISVDDKVVVGLSKNAGGARSRVSATVLEEYSAAGAMRTTCGEVRALTRAEERGIDMTGGTFATALVGGPKAGVGIAACDKGCSSVLKNRGIGDAVAGTGNTAVGTAPLVNPVLPESDRRPSN